MSTSDNFACLEHVIIGCGKLRGRSGISRQSPRISTTQFSVHRSIELIDRESPGYTKACLGTTIFIVIKTGMTDESAEKVQVIARHVLVPTTFIAVKEIGRAHV